MRPPLGVSEVLADVGSPAQKNYFKQFLKKSYEVAGPLLRTRRAQVCRKNGRKYSPEGPPTGSRKGTSGREDDAWTTSARALKGRFSPAVGIQHPRIDFLLSGRTAFLQFIVTNVRSLEGRTAIRVNVVDISPGYLTLKSKGRKTIRAGSAPADPEFDDWFVRARALPETLMSELISPGTKAKLTLPLLLLRRFGATTIDLGKESLSLELGSLLVEESPQIELASAMRTMMECFFGSASAFPIELVEVPNPECARCSVCGCELREQIVRCVACQTPHHEDCWRFNMRCSTYGCGETHCFR